MQGLHQGPKVNFNPGGVVSVGEGKPKLVSSPFRTAVILPNGQLWLKEQWVRLVRRFNKTEGVVVSVKTGRSYEGFLPEGKWKDVAVGHVSCFAIRADGTLWDLSYVQDGQPVPKQVGSDKGWRMISGGFAHFCALKSDGSLWQWGRFASNGTETFSTSNSEDVEPQRVGTDTDWTAVCDSGLAGVAIKTDGDIWRWGRILGKQPEGAKYHWVWGPERWLASSCTMPVSMDCSGFCIGIVCEDGTLWIGGSLADSFYRQFVEPGEAQRASREMVRLGKASDWSQFEFTGWRGAVGIKRDGSLYEWNLFETFQPWTGWILSPTRPSFYHDWMAAARFDDAYLALARDGNLCLWGDRNGGNSHDPNGPDPQQLLMPSRLKARRIANLSR
jgi:hypothetical protein